MSRKVVWAVLMWCVAAVAHAQQGTSDLRGRVVDSQQGAMPGVTVIVRNQESGLFRETTSGGDGSFFVSAMLPGVYEVEATLQGFKPYKRTDIRLAVGQTATVEIPLDIAGLTETLTVRGEAPLVDTTSTEVGGNINAAEFLDTPSMNRNFSSMLGLLPGVVTISGGGVFHDTLSVGGQNQRNMRFAVDGADNNDYCSGGGNGSQARIAMEAVQEFVLLTGQFDAEYGNGSGGVVNAVSKQGTNQLHGSGFVFFQDHKLSARDYFVRTQNLVEPLTKQRQSGGTIGGPIKKDKAHFFVSLEFVRYDKGFTLTVPGRPDLSVANVGNSTNMNSFIRGDHQINANNTWGVRWLRESSPQDLKFDESLNPTLAAVRTEDDVDQTAIGSMNSVIGATKVNTIRVGITQESLLCGNPNIRDNYFNDKGTTNQKGQLPTLDYVGYKDQQSERASDRDYPSYMIDDVFSWFLPNKGGEHELKFGFTYRYAKMERNDWTYENGGFVFGHNLVFNAADPRTWPERFQIRVPGPSHFASKGHYYNGFAQDKWKIGNRMTLNAGVRYDIELFRTPNELNPLFADNPDGYPIDKNNVQPRLGFSYALDGQGRSAVRAGFGIFTQQILGGATQPLFTDGRNSQSFMALFPNNNIDPGPRNGQFPTNPLLTTFPAVNHAAIDAMFPPGTVARNVGVVWFDNPDRVNPYSRQYSLGYQTQIGSTMGLSVDYLRSESRKQLLRMDMNPATRATALATGAVTRTNPLVGAAGEFANRVEVWVNEGYIDYDSLQLALSKRLSQGYSARVSYAYSKGRGNTATGQDQINSQYLNDLRLDTEVGPTSADRPHILSLSTSWDVPHTGGLKFSGVFQARSGTPFSLTNSTFDADQNGLTTNEYLPAGTYSGTGSDAITVENAGGRNGARSPAYVSTDIRAGYRFHFRGSRTLDAHVDVFNAFNRANFAPPLGDQRLASFLRLSLIQGSPRTAQLNVRLGF